MSECGDELVKIVEYMRAHWPSGVKSEWQVKIEEYPLIAKRVLAEWTVGRSAGGEFVRIAGLSGSGKTSQLLPAVEAYFEKKQKQPILVAARKFVEYHPYFEEIKAEYGEANLRKMTDEFATIMLFLTLKELIQRRFDLILDVTLLDPAMEQILMEMLKSQKYEAWMTMIAVSPEVTQRFLGKRAWRHTKETEREFIRVTELALEFYAKNWGEMRMVMWNVWQEEPVFDGKIQDCLDVWQENSAVTEMPEYDKEILKVAKINYLARL